MLAQLKAAACDGHLATVPGMGKKRFRGVRESLNGRLRRLPEYSFDCRARAPRFSLLLGLESR